MGTGERMATSIDPAQVLNTWFSPSYPVGAFAYSHGLEQVIADGCLTDGDGLVAWIEAVLRRGAAWADAVLIAQAMSDTGDADGLDEVARALAPSAERHRETLELGAAFVRVTSDVWQTDPMPRAYPVAVGLAARQLGLPVGTVLRFFLHGVAANLISVAVRIVPLGQTEGQRVMAALLPVIEEVVARAELASLDDLGTSVFAADIAAMRHETLPVRLFRT